MFDTHCHLNFSVFTSNIKEVIDRAKAIGVYNIVIPGTDISSSEKAVKIAGQYEGIYAAVGIHPHHIFEYRIENKELHVENEIKKIEELLQHPKVVAVGEVGIDRHYYQQTKYKNYQIDESFIDLQKEFLIKQIQLAAKYKKSLILHNREAKNDLLHILNTEYRILNTVPVVLHCCEPDDELLEFAVNHKIFIGVDGDVTYDKKKQEFIKKIPLEHLVLETDSPFLKPEGMKFPNEPKNLKIIAECIAKLRDIPIDQLIEETTKNAKKLFLQ